MNYKQIILATTTLLFWISSVLLFVFYYHFSFNYEINIQGQYYLLYTPIFSLLLMTYLFFFRVVRSIIVSVAVFLIIIGATLFFSEYYSFANEHFFVLTSIFTLSISILFTNQFFLRLLFSFLFLIFFYELYLGLSQYIDANSNYGDISLSIRGSLQNSGVYACYLAIQLPLFITLRSMVILPLKIFRKDSKSISITGKMISALTLLLTIFIIIQTKSRTAYIAVTITALTWLFLEYRDHLWKKIKSVPLLSSAILGGIVIITISCCYYLLGIKKMSAVGRLLCADITWRHIKDDFWLGTGIGRFTLYYPEWQSQYFQTKLEPPIDYFLSAGESYIIFNEYLQLFKEIGFVGFALFITALFLFFRATSSTHTKLLGAVKLCMVGILSSSVTSYPLHVNIILLLMGVCGAIAYKISDKKKLCNMEVFNWVNTRNRLNRRNLLKTQRGFIIVSLIIISLNIYDGFKEYFTLVKWQAITSNDATAIASDISSRTPENLLNNNGKFLSVYGLWLTQDSARSAEGIQMLEKARTYFISRNSIEYLAKAYLQVGNYEKSIEQWQWVSNYLPNRFLPRYELMNIYLATGDTINAKKTAHAILEIPVKFYSGEIERIKLAAGLLIK
ncbi:MAG: O-antigen ligase family protein [Agriterribacter sp.]